MSVTDNTSSLPFPSSLLWLERGETGGSNRMHHDPPVYRPIHFFSFGIAAVGVWWQRDETEGFGGRFSSYSIFTFD